MPNIASGASATVTLRANQRASIQAPGGVSASVSVDGVVRDVVSGDRVVGPYPGGSSVQITAQGGAVFYEILSGRDPEVLQAPARLRSVAAASKIFSGAGNAVTAGYTIVTQHPARRSSFAAAKLVYANWGASSYTITTARVASTSTHQDTGASSTWHDVTLPGGGVVAAATGTGNDIVPSLYTTDIIACPSVARTDDASKTALLQCRTYFAAAASAISLNAGEIAAFNASSVADGMQFASAPLAGDMTATFGAAQRPLETGTWIAPAAVIFHYPGVKSVVLASAGDSLSKGHLTTGGATGWVARLAAKLTTDEVEVSPAVWAWTGQKHAASMAIARNVVSTLRPDYLCFAAWSPNDATAGNHTQAVFDAGLARALDLIEHCRQNGVQPVLMTAMPWGALTAAENARRRALNVTLRSLSDVAIIVDAASALEDPSDTSKILPAYDSGDGGHPNDAGHEAVSALAAAAIGSIS